MAGEDIFVGPEPWVGGDSDVEAGRGGEVRVEEVEEGPVVGDVFEDIEESGGGEGAGESAEVLEGGMDDKADSAGEGVADPGESGFDESDIVAGALEGGGDTSIAAADVEERAGGGEAPDKIDEAAVAVAEPERIVFDGEAEGVAVFGIGDRRGEGDRPPAARSGPEIGGKGG